MGMALGMTDVKTDGDCSMAVGVGDIILVTTGELTRCVGDKARCGFSGNGDWRMAVCMSCAWSVVRVWASGFEAKKSCVCVCVFVFVCVCL